jgi:serine/threonine-protein kinase
MGAVFLAVDEATGQRRAVKIVRAEHLNDVVVRTRLEREAQLMARIDHPGVVTLVDSGELPDGSRFLVMELLEGFDLGRILESRGPGTPAQVAEVLRQTGAALQAAHLLGVLHRDLKPSNLFLQPRAAGFGVKVVDFGLAKSMGEKSKATQTGFVVGSPMYMSPEQIREEGLDGRSDLFSLASVGYELLTGIAAFEGPNVAEIFTRILQRPPAALSTFLPGFPEDVEAIYSEAFEKKAARRPAGVGAWVARVVPALERVPSTVAGWPIEAIRAEAAGLVVGFVAESTV